MTTFDDREKAFEAKYALDQEQEFKAIARRNRMLGLWAAEKMGLSSESADQYAAAVVRADFEQPGDEDVFRKVAGDFKASGLSVSEGEIRSKIDELASIAREQLAGCDRETRTLIRLRVAGCDDPDLAAVGVGSDTDRDAHPFGEGRWQRCLQ